MFFSSIVYRRSLAVTKPYTFLVASLAASFCNFSRLLLVGRCFASLHGKEESVRERENGENARFSSRSAARLSSSPAHLGKELMQLSQRHCLETVKQTKNNAQKEKKKRRIFHHRLGRRLSRMSHGVSVTAASVVQEDAEEEGGHCCCRGGWLSARA